MPLGILKVRIVEWKNIPLGYEYTVTPRNSTIIVPGIYRVSVFVQGSRGQALSGARVRIYYGGVPVEEGITTDGLYTTLLPQGEYRIEAVYADRISETTLKVEAPREARITLDVFVEIGGLPLTQAEFITIIIIVALLILGIYILLYEYGAWRRKRLLARLAPSS